MKELTKILLIHSATVLPVSLVAFFYSILIPNIIDNGLLIILAVILALAMLLMPGLVAYYQAKNYKSSVNDSLLSCKDQLRIYKQQLELLLTDIQMTGEISRDFSQRISKGFGNICLNPLSLMKDGYILSNIIAIFNDHEWIAERKKYILQRLCNFLTSNPIGEHSISDFFNATLFRNIDNHILKRDAYYYPPPLISKIEEVNIEKSKNSTFAVCMREKVLIIIKDISEELKKHKPRWMKLRKDQDKSYNSLISIPIFTCTELGPANDIVSILTIGTNRKYYFDEAMESQIFWDKFLSPITNQISILYLIEKISEDFKANGIK